MGHNTNRKNKQAANYEMLHTEERNYFYNLMKKYEGNLVNYNIKTESKVKLRKLIRDEFNTIWHSGVVTAPPPPPLPHEISPPKKVHYIKVHKISIFGPIYDVVQPRKSLLSAGPPE